MGLNLDLRKMLGLPVMVTCPKCKRQFESGTNDYDIECGHPNRKPGAWELSFWCDECDTEFELEFTVSSSLGNSLMPIPCPEPILEQIAQTEADRLGFKAEEILLTLRESAVAYFPSYSTLPLSYYTGPLVSVVWTVSPGNASSFILQDGAWINCQH